MSPGICPRWLLEWLFVSPAELPLSEHPVAYGHACPQGRSISRRRLTAPAMACRSSGSELTTRSRRRMPPSPRTHRRCRSWHCGWRANRRSGLGRPSGASTTHPASSRACRAWWSPPRYRRARGRRRFTQRPAGHGDGPRFGKPGPAAMSAPASYVMPITRSGAGCCYRSSRPAQVP